MIDLLYTFLPFLVLPLVWYCIMDVVMEKLIGLDYLNHLFSNLLLTFSAGLVRLPI